MSPFPPPNSYPDKGPRPRLGVSVRSNWTGPVVQLDDLSGWLHRPAEWLNEWMDWPAPIGIQGNRTSFPIKTSPNLIQNAVIPPSTESFAANIIFHRSVSLENVERHSTNRG